MLWYIPTLIAEPGPEFCFHRGRGHDSVKYQVPFAGRKIIHVSLDSFLVLNSPVLSILLKLLAGCYALAAGTLCHSLLQPHSLILWSFFILKVWASFLTYEAWRSRCHQYTNNILFHLVRKCNRLSSLSVPPCTCYNLLYLLALELFLNLVSHNPPSEMPCDLVLLVLSLEASNWQGPSLPSCPSIVKETRHIFSYLFSQSSAFLFLSLVYLLEVFHIPTVVCMLQSEKLCFLLQNIQHSDWLVRYHCREACSCYIIIKLNLKFIEWHL